jgi:hypothetical protein
MEHNFKRYLISFVCQKAAPPKAAPLAVCGTSKSLPAVD